LSPCPVFLLNNIEGDTMATTTKRAGTETPVVRTATEAREGVVGHNVRYVLMLSTAAVVLIFGGLWLFYFH
jgi:hypothetical protein